MIYYSKIKTGFYRPEIHGENIPSDAVEVSEEDWIALLDGQSKGKAIASDANGRPGLRDPTPTKYVPYSVPKAKAKYVLAQAGKLAPLLAHIETLPDDDLQKLAFMDIADWERDSPTLIALAKGVLRLNDDGIDDFFIAANAVVI